MNEKYTPTTLPRKLELTIYTAYCIDGYRAGELVNYDFDPTGDQYVVVAKTPLSVKIPKHDDLKDKVIEALEAEKKKQVAEHVKKMNEIQHKIESLLCLEYQPKEVTLDETSNVIPF